MMHQPSPVSESIRMKYASRAVSVGLDPAKDPVGLYLANWCSIFSMLGFVLAIMGFALSPIFYLGAAASFAVMLRWCFVLAAYNDDGPAASIVMALLLWPLTGPPAVLCNVLRLGPSK